MQYRAAPGEMENKALTTVRSGIHSWLEMRRPTRRPFGKQSYTEQRKAIKAELGAFHFRIPNCIMLQVAPEVRNYAFTHHVSRELRAHTSMWTNALKATQPGCLLGRARLQQNRAMASESLQDELLGHTILQEILALACSIIALGYLDVTSRCLICRR